jgi:DNA repair protein RecO (recombination protein O)
MTPEKETDAIVLDCRDQGESDKIVTFFCRQAGRLSGIAKGAKRSKQRFVNKLELFSWLQLTYSLPRHGSLAFIAAAELQSSFLNLRQNVALYNTATVIREFVLMGSNDKDRDNRVFEILLWALQALDDRRPVFPTVIIFLIRFFEYIGYRPDLSRCYHCGHPLSSQERYGFNYAVGSIVCATCSGQGSQATTPLSLGTIRLLTDVQNHPLERLHRLQFSTLAEDESLNMLHRYGRQLFQRDIQSWETLKRNDTRQSRGVKKAGNEA